MNSENDPFKEALEEMETHLHPHFDEMVCQTQDPIAQACLIVGRDMQIPFKIPAALAEIQDPEKKLEAICQESQIQMRKVLLEGDWKDSDHGPLVAFWGSGNKPAALLFKDGYQLVDPESVQSVHSSLAEQISPGAYMFYAPYLPRSGLFKKIFHFIAAKNWKTALFCLFAALFCAVLPSFAVKYLFEFAIPENDSSLILYLSFGLFFSSIGYALYRYLHGLFFLSVKGHSINFISGAFWSRLFKIPSAVFQHYSAGDLTSRVFCLEAIFRRFDLHFLSPLLAGLFSLVYLGAMLYFVPFLGWLVFSLSAFALVLCLLCAHFKIKLLRKSLALESSIQGALLKFVVGIGKLRAARAESHAFSYWTTLFASYQSRRKSVQSLQDTAQAIGHFFPLLSLFLVYWAMLEWIPAKQVHLSDFLAFQVAFGSYCLSIYPFGEALVQFSDILPLWERAEIFLKEEVEEPRRKPLSPKLTGRIEVENLVYSSPSNLHPLLDDISLSVQPGEFIGIVGKGKTLILRLLLGLEKPQSGAIFLDGKDLRSFELRSVREQIGVYFQDLRMFSSNVQAVLMSKKNSEEELQQASAFSLFNKDLASFPMKGKTGTNTLSGSQKARLFLAKAVLGNPPILLLDEPTASFDMEMRKNVNANIANWKGTRIYATNRLCNIRKADRIYVIDQGKITQTGTFQELAGQPGLFATLLSKQKKP